MGTSAILPCHSPCCPLPHLERLHLFLPLCWGWFKRHSTLPGSQEVPVESLDQEQDDWEFVGSVEPADLSAPVVLREELLQFLKNMHCSRKKLQLALDCWGNFYQVLHLVRALVGEGKGYKWSNSKNYYWA